MTVSLATASAANAAPIQFNGRYAQDFDSLASAASAASTTHSWVNGVTLPGWYLFNSAGQAIAQYDAANGSSSKGTFGSLGLAGGKDRALGATASGGAYFGSPATGAVAGWIALAATNSSAAAIESLSIRFNGEQWRNGGNASSHSMELEYGFGDSFGAVANWKPAGSAFNWASPVTGGSAKAVDGNAAGRVSGVGGVLQSLGWQPGATLWLRWVDKNEPGSDHGMAIDDLELVAAGAGAGTNQLTFTPRAGTAWNSSDASTALPQNDDWMIVGDDEASVLRVYPRAGGDAVIEWSFADALGLGSAELDVEASARLDQMLFFIGSHGNKRDGDEADSRERLFAVTMTGAGDATAFAYAGHYSGLEQALVSWDEGNRHGKGAGYYGLAASSAPGVKPEAPAGFSIEGLAATTGGQLLLGFRAPQISAARSHALLLPLNNPQAILSGAAPDFGAPIELDLGGRGIRSIERAEDGSYLIIAGPASPASTTASSRHFVLYAWDGVSPAASPLDNALDPLLQNTQGSFETLLMPAGTAPGTRVQLLQDNGDTVWPGQSKASKDLPPGEQRFIGHWITLGQTQAADTTPPQLRSSTPAASATDVGMRAPITLRFSERVRPGSGQFALRCGAATQTLQAGDPNVRFNDSEVTLSPAAARPAGVACALTIQNTPVLDEAGNPWVGGTLNFTTGAGSRHALLISEVNSNAKPGDFFELHNYGTSPIDLSGWKWIDSTGQFDHPDAASFAAGSILAPGGTVVVLTSKQANADEFRNAWGLTGSSTPIWLVPGQGLGKGDAVLVYDTQANLAAAVNYGTSTIVASHASVPPTHNGLGQPPTVDRHAGPAFATGSPLPGDGVSAVWDGQSADNPKYIPAASGALGAFGQPGAVASVGSPGVTGTSAPRPPSTAAVTRIHAIQGAGENSPLHGQRVTVEAVVTAWLPGMNGFFIQEEKPQQDSDPRTSEGIFVYYGNANANPGVSAATVGQRVRLTASVSDFRNNTQLAGSIADFSVLGAGAMPAAVELALPVSDMATLEAHEGMLVQVRAASGDPLVVTDNYSLGRYGTVTLTPKQTLVQFTEDHAPDIAGYSQFALAARRSQIQLDDAQGNQNPATVPGRGGQPLSASNTLRTGDTTSVVVGVLDEFYDSGADLHQTSYRVQPTQTVAFAAGSERPSAADLRNLAGNATVKVGTANVLNFFNIVGATSGSQQVKFRTPLGNEQGIRGANSDIELKRQTAKLSAMLIGMDADAIGLLEIQNNGFGPDSALAALVQALNASADKPAGATYDYIKGPFSNGVRDDIAAAGSDAITTAIIYRSDRLTPQGQARVADSARYPAFSATGGSRAPLAQSFAVALPGGGSESFTLVVNHFKSKGSLLPGDGNRDKLDGQGQNNQARVEAANQLHDWLNSQPGGAPSNLVLVGDFNAYSREDPITALQNHGYRKVSQGHSYAFRGLHGSLDHIFISPRLLGRTGPAVKWAINAEEPVVLDYNTEFLTPAQQSAYYESAAYRSSDHNPIVMGLNLGATPGTGGNSAPVIRGAGGAALPVTAGLAAALPGLSVADADNDRLSLSLHPANGQLLGVSDADPAQPGIQLQGLAADINAQLASALFVASAPGAASLRLELGDGVTPAVQATVAMTASAAAAAPDHNKFVLDIPGQGRISGHMAGGGSACRLAAPPQAVSINAAGATTLPRPGAAMPYGLLALNAQGCDRGSVVTVTLNLPAALPADAEYWKWGRSANSAGAPHWYALPAITQGNTIRFALQDGGLGDDDLQADGSITDPGGPVISSGPINSNLTPVPTLGNEFLLAMGLLLAGFGARRISRFGSRQHTGQ